MDKLARDLLRLERYTQDPLGLEFLAPIHHLGNFINYYFTRFVKNISHVFSDFSGSLILDFNQKYKTKLHVLDTKTFSYRDKLVQIPGGMQLSYQETLDGLLKILQEIHVDSLYHELKDLTTVFTTGVYHHPQIHACDGFEFERLKRRLQPLYSEKKIHVTTGAAAFPNASDFGKVNKDLLAVTQTYYKTTIQLPALLTDLETQHKHIALKLEDKDKVVLMHDLMSLAYRLSLFSVVIDHIQTMEFCFTKTLATLLA